MALPMHTQEWIPSDTFGARLALVRQELGGWNVKRTAALCGINDQSWRNWEAGKGKPRDLEATCHDIADATGCNFAWLMVGGSLRTGSFANLRLVTSPPGQLSMLDDADHALELWSRADLVPV